MKDHNQSSTPVGEPHAAEVEDVVGAIVELLHPERIYLYNQRFSIKGGTSGFKLCVIAGVADKPAAERDMYLKIDSDVPFDVILYTPEEWEQLCLNPDSFARKIYLTGMVVYG